MTLSCFAMNSYFVVSEFLKWCHQESNKFDKWLYFFEFILCKRPNLPLLLHRFSAMLCFFFVGDILICAQR